MKSRCVRAACVMAVLHAGVSAQAVFTWTQASPAASPSPRYWHAMAYDEVRNRVVLVGGTSGPGADTWEWDGVQWHHPVLATVPQANRLHGLAYDAARQRTVLFGGQDTTSGNYYSETWEWDGSTWTLRAPPSRPSARASHAMAYDSVRQRVVLFGGTNNVTGPLGDTWEWDGTTWLPRFSVTYPAPRTAMCMAYDPVRHRTMIFGGWNSSGVMINETWEWDGGNWLQATPGTAPSARVWLAAGYHHTRQRVLVFGGYGTGSGDTWEWDGTNWVQLAPAQSPGDRCGHAMTFDFAQQRLVLFGGLGGGGLLGDTWTTGLFGTPASAVQFGSGCGSPPVGFVPDPSQRPISGQSGGATLVNSPTPFGAVMIGLSNQFYGPFSLPVTLAGIGMPGCDLLQSADIMGFPVTPLTANSMAFSAFLAPSPSLVGLHVYLQAYVLAPGTNALEILVSNGIDWFVGNV